MFVITNPIQLYGRKILTDLALKSGLPAAKDFSPYIGLHGAALNYIKQDTSADLEYLFEAQLDFDADKNQPHIDADDDYSEAEEQTYTKESQFNPAIDKVKFARYNRHLEDIHYAYVSKYFGEICYNIAHKGNSGGVITYAKKHYIQPTLSGIDNEGEVNELADLVMQKEEEKYSETDRAIATERLPYVVKRLHILSKLCGVSMLSLIAAYVKSRNAYLQSNVTGRSQRSFKHTAVYRYTIYKCNQMGVVYGGIDRENKNINVKNMFDWLEGDNDDYPSYRHDYLDYVRYMEILNISWEDDWTQYNESFLSSIPCYVLPNNAQYEIEVARALGGSAMKVKTDIELLRDKTLATVDIFRNMAEYNVTIQQTMETQSSGDAAKNLKDAHNLYCMCLVKHGKMQWPKEHEFFWSDGFLCSNDGIVYFNAEDFSDDSFVSNNCILSELGIMLNISSVSGLYYMYLAEARMNFTLRLKSGGNVVKLLDWKVFQ